MIDVDAVDPFLDGVDTAVAAEALTPGIDVLRIDRLIHGGRAFAGAVVDVMRHLRREPRHALVVDRRHLALFDALSQATRIVDQAELAHTDGRGPRRDGGRHAVRLDDIDRGALQAR